MRGQGHTRGGQPVRGVKIIVGKVGLRVAKVILVGQPQTACMVSRSRS